MSGQVVAERAGTGWQEVYLGGSKEAEDEMIRRQFAPDVLDNVHIGKVDVGKT